MELTARFLVLIVVALASQLVAYYVTGFVQHHRIDHDWPESNITLFWERMDTSRYDRSAQRKIRIAQVVNLVGYVAAVLAVLSYGGFL